MRDGWKFLPLSSVSSESKNIKWKDIAKDKQYRYIDLTSVSREMKSITEPQLINKDNAPSRAQRIIQTDDILFATTRPTLRRFCIVPTAYDGQICSTGYCVIRPNKEEILPSWIFYLLSSDLFYDYIEPLQTGATYPAVTDTDVRGYLAPIPSLAEQQRIVDILDEAFEKIDTLKANAEQNLQDAKALFKAALRKELEPKDGWVEKTLKDIGKTQTGTTPKTSDKGNYGDYIPFIKPADVNTDGLGGLNYGNEGLSQQGAANGRVFASGSILMVCIGATIGKVGYAIKQVSSNQQINVLTPKTYYDSKFLYYCMASPAFQFKVIKEGESAKATLPIINKSKWESLTVHIPNLMEQNTIVARLDNLNDRCKVLQTNYDKTLTLCDDLKQALLRKAFNGEL